MSSNIEPTPEPASRRKRKLEDLTRSIAQRRFDTARRILDTIRADAPAAPVARPQPLRLAQVGPGREWQKVVAPPAGGCCWLVEQPIGSFSPGDAPLSGQFAAILGGARQRYDELAASADLCHLTNVGPQDVLFMDTETCGFAGSPIFLVGLLNWHGGELLLRQYLARDYSEEESILRAYAEHAGSHAILVTFNGKSFDVPRIAERSAFYGIQPPWQEPRHIDLLHECRRHYRKLLPDCRLQTLERHLCGRIRTGDIPGSAIPEAYHRFVDTDDARQMRDILHHNALDLITLAQLVNCILTGTAPLPGDATR